MRANESTVLVGEKVALVPYRTEHVPTYHTWMESPELREQTASERLTLEQEHAMQRAWHLDEDKLTFILLARVAPLPCPCDANDRPFDAAQGLAPLDPPPGLGAELGQAPSPVAGLQAWLASLPMVGDVNLFFSRDEQADEDGDSAHDEERQPPCRKAGPTTYAECEVMVADPRFRRRGLGYEALKLMLAYCQIAKPTAASLQRSSKQEQERDLRLDPGSVPGPGLTCSPSTTPEQRYAPGDNISHKQNEEEQEQITYVAKVGLGNVPSRNLFSRLGFEEHKIVAVFDEVELRLPRTKLETPPPPVQVFFWPRP